MPNAPAAYLTDVAYPAHFHREMMPLWLHATLTGIGVQAPPVHRPFTWLELGCGSAVNLLAAAAHHPQAQFIGVDVSAREIQQAQQWAHACGITNVHLVCADFAGLAFATSLHDWIPDWLHAAGCDYIVTHGVYSWVDAAVRDSIHRIVAQHLQPLGIAYVAYSSQPGSASFAATQRLMHLNAQRLSGDSAVRARNSMDLVLTLAKGGAGYFVEHPAALRELERMKDMDAAYLAHEFLNSDWCAHHVADVMADFNQSGCAYAGSATPVENIDALSLPAKLQVLFSHMQAQGISTAQIETAKDLARNQNMRRDLYQKQAINIEQPGDRAALLPATQHRNQLLAQHVMLLPAAQEASQNEQAMRLPTRIGPVELAVAHTQPLLQALRHGSQSYTSLAQLPAYADNPGLLNPLLQTLAWAGWIAFVQPTATAAEAAAIEQRLHHLREKLHTAARPDLANAIRCTAIATQ